jgi:hypothetical protein
MDNALDTFSNTKAKQDLINGLLLAQMICRRRIIEAFDKNQQEIVLLIMSDIVETIDKIVEESNKDE